MSIETPDISHLSLSDYANVYEPSEDTFLLIDSLEKDLEFLTMQQSNVVMEVGTGSGIVITALAKCLGPDKLYLATDINPKACEAARRTAVRHNVSIEVVCCDLVMPLHHRFRGKVDVLVFNPPYVVTSSDEVKCDGISRSWAGGVRGREVMDRLFPLVPHLLSVNGVFYIVSLKQNDIDDIQMTFYYYGFKMELVLERRAGIEKLFVLRFRRFNAAKVC